MEEKTYCVIMAGGIGSRFWPMSRTELPKQFLDFLGLGRTLLQQTYDRFRTICPAEHILVVTNAQYAGIVQEQLPELGPGQILAEPFRRNTAPCVAYASHAIAARLDRGQDTSKVGIIVAPSDHLVLKEEAFRDSIGLALRKALSEETLVTLGIMPHRPDTGYGYIQFRDDEPGGHPKVKRVKTFTEKPDHETAQRFLESGDFLWNSGIFIWSLSSINHAFQKHLPDMDARFGAGRAHYGGPGEQDFIAATYEDCESISIDYGIMEKAGNVHVVVSDIGWSDLGTWGSLYSHLPKDAAQNAVVGPGVRLYDAQRNMVHAHDDRLIVLQGLEDVIVVSTRDALLVCRKQDEQKIRQFVNDLKAEGMDGYL